MILNPVTALWGSYFGHSYFAEEETEAQSRQKVCQGVGSLIWAHVGTKRLCPEDESGNHPEVPGGGGGQSSGAPLHCVGWADITRPMDSIIPSICIQVLNRPLNVRRPMLTKDGALTSMGCSRLALPAAFPMSDSTCTAQEPGVVRSLCFCLVIRYFSYT